MACALRGSVRSHGKINALGEVRVNEKVGV
jgi:hypothetical protein